MIIALCDGSTIPPQRGFILNLRWLWHPDHRPKVGPYAVPVILFRVEGDDIIYSPTILKMNGDERAEDFFVLPIMVGSREGFSALLRSVAKQYRKILADPSHSAARFDYWMKTKDPTLQPAVLDKREAVLSLAFAKWRSQGANRPARVSYLQKILRSPGSVNVDLLRKMERKLGLQ